jgi:diketogulonate reductase-like aldo/keto reductase
MKITDICGTVELRNSVKMPYFGLGVFQVNDGEEVVKSCETRAYYRVQAYRYGFPLWK